MQKSRSLPTAIAIGAAIAVPVAEAAEAAFSHQIPRHTIPISSSLPWAGLDHNDPRSPYWPSSMRNAPVLVSSRSDFSSRSVIKWRESTTTFGGTDVFTMS